MGTVYLVGAGPGDPKLITLKGMEILQACDIIIYDKLASDSLLQYAKKGCVKLYVGKEPGHHSKSQEEINQIIVESAARYETVVRLKGGDPFVFGRGGEEMEELLRHNISCEVIPGITSAVSVPASIGIPVTHRGVSQSFHVITGHTRSPEHPLTNDYEALARLNGTLVFLMGLSNLKEIVDKLVWNGKDMDTPAAVISNGTMDREKAVKGTLKDIVSKVEAENVVSPAVIVIGDVVKLDFVQINESGYSQSASLLAHNPLAASLPSHSGLEPPLRQASPTHRLGGGGLAWEVKKPLSDLKIGITGTREMRDKLEKGLSGLGADVYTLCDMYREEVPSFHDLKKEILLLEQYQWIVFTSQNAVRIFFDTMEREQVDRRRLSHVRFAVIGSGTGHILQTYGYFADFIPSRYTGVDLANELSQVVRKGENILIPRALRGNKEFTDILEKHQIHYKEIPIYDVKGHLTEQGKYIPEMDGLVFVSASGVDAFFEQVHKVGIELPPEVKIACIGGVTAEALRKQKRDADIIAEESNIDGLMEAMEQNRTMYVRRNCDESYEKTAGKRGN